jgi:hypothetical protein
VNFHTSVFWVMCRLAGGYQHFEEYVASIFRVEIWRLTNWLGYKQVHWKPGERLHFLTHSLGFQWPAFLETVYRTEPVSQPRYEAKGCQNPGDRALKFSYYLLLHVYMSRQSVRLFTLAVSFQEWTYQFKHSRKVIISYAPGRYTSIGTWWDRLINT